MEEEFYTEWDEGYQEAAALLDGRDDAIDEQVSAVEADVELVGVTAIEDKLQEGVPAAIQTLLDAGMKVPFVLLHAAQHHGWCSYLLCQCLSNVSCS